MSMYELFKTVRIEIQYSYVINYNYFDKNFLLLQCQFLKLH